MVARKHKAVRRAPAVAAAGKAPASVAVDEEERLHLIESCAFFRAERFREAEPGHIREQDKKAAAAAIDAVIRKRKQR
jgi:hypothetical protein